MQKTYTFFCLLLFAVCIGIAQTDQSAPQILENIHLHLNKTTFIKGERLWFKAYVQNQKNQLPSLNTTNFHVGIYDKKGDEIKRKLLYTENGMASGDFAIDSTFTGTDYKILAWTNYQRNFKQLNPFQQHIKIVQEDVQEKDVIENELIIEVYPEGGYLIEGAFNHIGIVLSREGGKRVSENNLELVDGLGNVVRSNITTNSLGLGKIGFMVEQGTTYFLQWGNDDIGYSRKSLPSAKSQTIGLNIDNNGKDNVLVKLIASKQTFKKKDGENYSVAFYQDESIVFEDVEIIEEESVIALQRKSLPYGLNTAVLFDGELKPVSFRMFFNHRNDKKRLQSIEVEHCLSEFGDSIQVDFIRPKNSTLDANVSISVLPGSSNAYNPENSIASAFLVQPYLKNAFKGSYYFDDMDRKKRFELDKRLIIEGWGKYDWDSRKLETLKLEFAMETGIPISGKVIDADLTEENQVSLVTDFSGAYAFEELENDKAFSSKMDLFEGDSLGISLMGRKGKLRKPNVEVQFSNSTPLGFETGKWLNFEKVISQKQVDEIVEIDQSLNLGERTIVLDEVTVTEKKQVKDKFTIAANANLKLISDDDIKKYVTLEVMLRKLGFRVLNQGQRYAPDGTPLAPGLEAQMKRYPYSVIPIVINGYYSSKDPVFNFPLTSISSVVYNGGSSPFINVTSRESHYVRPENRDKFLKFAIENGYARPQDYFTPNYPDYTTSIFKNYGALDWKANTLIGAEIPTTVMVPIKGQRTLKVFIEGMDINGNLFTQNNIIETTNID